MGRKWPSKGRPPRSQLKEARAKRAKQTINVDIPALLQAHPRAKLGVESSERIVNPPTVRRDGKPKSAIHQDDTSSLLESLQLDPSEPSISENTADSTPIEPLKIRFRVADTLQAAADLLNNSNPYLSKSNRVAVLNKASPLRPGGGFLNGAVAQEESLCMRSTLYPALDESFYRLPEFGGVWTSDVLVFRSHHEDSPDLPKNERFFVDVITAAMLRHPDVETGEDGELHYTNERDWEIAERKMRAVMRIAKSKGVKKLVLGAWGCGAYKNPVRETAKIWRKVLLGGNPYKSKPTPKAIVTKHDRWDGMEIVFAIIQQPKAEVFAQEFEQEVEVEDDADANEEINVQGFEGNEEQQNEAEGKIAELESQISATRSDILKDRLQTVLAKLKNEEGQ